LASIDKFPLSVNSIKYGGEREGVGDMTPKLQAKKQEGKPPV
jgi:hypothetical protein